MRSLLDVNILIALLDDAHLFSEQANAFIDTPNIQIATCPMIENAVIRIMNLPGYGRLGPVGFQRVRDQLSYICKAVDHQFWPDDISLLDPKTTDLSRVHGHNQITDLYLLALSVEHGGRLATFDQAIALSAVPKATNENLLVL